MKTTIGCFLAAILLFVGSVYAADTAQQATVASGLPRITLEAGPIVMTRVQSNRNIWSSPGHQGSGDILKSSDIDDDWRVGGQARLTFTFPSVYLDLGGFLIPTNTKTVHPFLATGVSTIETTPLTLYGDGSGFVGTFKYASSIANLDVNIGHKFTPWLSAYAGVRYIKLKEELDLFVPFGGGAFNDDNWKAKNSMAGPQIGVRADILKVAALPASSPWSLDTNIALAMLHNEASTDFLNTANPPYSPHASASASFWTPGVAAEADLGYRLTGNIKLALGYQMLYLSRVALAPNQVGGTGNFNPPDGLKNSTVEKSSVLYHGAVAKLIITLL